MAAGGIQIGLRADDAYPPLEQPASVFETIAPLDTLDMDHIILVGLLVLAVLFFGYALYRIVFPVYRVRFGSGRKAREALLSAMDGEKRKPE